MPSLHHVRSPDGTPIAVQVTGAGPPLVLVHGTMDDRTRWGPVLAGLTARFTVFAMDRRGRGDSGDAPVYSVEREFEDAAAVLATAAAGGTKVDLVAHSFGALCALEGARRSPHVRRLVLYEPPVPAGEAIIPGPVLDRARALLAAGDRAGVLTTFFREVLGASPAVLQAVQQAPSWPARVATAPTVVREMEVERHHRFDPSLFAAFAAPTLLLLGTESPRFLHRATEWLRAALPHSRVALLPGQQHAAMSTAPNLFLREVLAFLGEEPT